MLRVLSLASELFRPPQTAAVHVTTETEATSPSNTRRRLFQGIPGDTLAVHLDRICVVGFLDFRQLYTFLGACGRTQVRPLLLSLYLYSTFIYKDI